MSTKIKKKKIPEYRQKSTWSNREDSEEMDWEKIHVHFHEKEIMEHSK